MNEFVGAVFPPLTIGIILNVLVSGLKCYTSANPQPNIGQGEIKACEDFANIDDKLVFPLRQAVVFGVEKPEARKSWLGNPVPNPAGQSATIAFALKQNTGTELELFDAASGKVVMRQKIEAGKNEIEVSFHSLASGIYGYRLSGEWQRQGSRKLVVIK